MPLSSLASNVGPHLPFLKAAEFESDLGEAKHRDPGNSRNLEVPVTMSTLHFRRVERRRTTRVAVFADLTVQGFNQNNEKFKIQTRSLSVSGHGGLTVLDAAVTVGQKLFLVNEISKQKAECKVVSLRSGSDGKNLVGFEFASPQPNFWKMTFPASGTKPFRRSLPSTATA
jgi:hypothetical protein